jgi:hypothetical protein
VLFGVGEVVLVVRGVVVRLLVVFVVVCVGLCCVCGVVFGFGGGRVFELVSPVYKGGFGASHIEAVAGDGDSVAFYSPGVFAGAPTGLSQNIDSLDYLARRGVSGWSTVPIIPPAGVAPYVLDRDISPNLEETLALGKPGPNFEAAEQEGIEEGFFLHATGMPDGVAGWELAGMMLKTVNEEPFTLVYRGASPDFCHMFFKSPPPTSKKNAGVVVEAADGTVGELYELGRGCDGEHVAVRIVVAKGSGTEEKPMNPACEVDLGIEDYDFDALNSYNAIAADGDSVFTTTCVVDNANEPAKHQLFARLGTSKTVEVSKPLDDICGEEELPCKGASEHAGANFAGASEDGSRVFFTTTQALVPEDKDAGNDLYMATLGCPVGEACPVANRRVMSLVQVSHDPNGGEAGVQGVVRVAPDGARVYFVAAGDLLSGAEQSALEAAHRAVPRVGAENMYVYDVASGQMQFIGDLCSGYVLSGSVEDSRCPNQTGVDDTLWSAASEAQTAGSEGQFLVFSSYAQLTSDDTDTARDVYRYDAASGVLERVSIGEDGYDADGNNNQFNASIAQGNRGGSVQLQYELNDRAISEDGSRIVFTTAEPLSPRATNHLTNAYEWHETPGGGSSVTLLSGGSSSTPVEDVVISAEGNDVFFVTAQGLVAQDVDGAPDVYDARIGGGFPPVPAQRQPCSGDACQGPLTNPAPLLVPASVSQTPGENLPPPAVAVAVKSKKKTKTSTKKKASKKKKKAKRASRRAKRDVVDGSGGRG